MLEKFHPAKNSPAKNSLAAILLSLWMGLAAVCFGQPSAAKLSWSELPPIPNELGLAGPIVGVHHGMLVVGGGTNFPNPVWETQKQWLSELYGLERTASTLQWRKVGRLPHEIAYAACATTSKGIVVAGGNDSVHLFDRCWLLQWKADNQKIEISELPKLPQPCAYGQACAIGDVVYLAGGQSQLDLDSAMSNLWRLDLTEAASSSFGWEKLPRCPGPPRAFNITVALIKEDLPSVFVIGGRFEVGGDTKFLDDCWEFEPSSNRWQSRAKLPRPITAGTAIGTSSTEIVALSGDDGSLFTRTEELKDKHPGFPRITYLYDASLDAWQEAGTSPANQVTTLAARFEGVIVIPSGEIRPRVRTPKVWSIQIPTLHDEY